MGKKIGQKKKQMKLEDKIAKLNELIPDINRICINLQFFYESEKMYQNKIKAGLINQKLKVDLINYINELLDTLEKILCTKQKGQNF